MYSVWCICMKLRKYYVEKQENTIYNRKFSTFGWGEVMGKSRCSYKKIPQDGSVDTS